jgi:hypothetical protein
MTNGRVLEGRALGGDMEMIQAIGLKMALVQLPVLAVWSTRKLLTLSCTCA